MKRVMKVGMAVLSASTLLGIAAQVRRVEAGTICRTLALCNVPTKVGLQDNEETTILTANGILVGQSVATGNRIGSESCGERRPINARGTLCNTEPLPAGQKVLGAVGCTGGFVGPVDDNNDGVPGN